MSDGCWWWQEISAAAGALRTLQLLEPSTSASAGALYERRVRSATLERQVAALEAELATLRSPPPALSHASLYDRAELPFKRQVSFLLNDVRVARDGRATLYRRPTLRASTATL